MYPFNRFIKRLALPRSARFNLKRFQVNHNLWLLKRFALENQNPHSHSQTTVLELYYGIRERDSGDLSAESICRDGFPQQEGRCGKGIYLGNHSRFAMWQQDNKDYCTAIVTHVHPDVILNNIKRFNSKINSGSNKWHSEYFVENPNIVYPAYVIDYTIT